MHTDRQQINAMLKDLHWLRVKERISFKILLIMHKCVIGSAPTELRVKPLKSEKCKVKSER